MQQDFVRSPFTVPIPFCTTFSVKPSPIKLQLFMEVETRHFGGCQNKELCVEEVICARHAERLTLSI